MFQVPMHPAQAAKALAASNAAAQARASHAAPNAATLKNLKGAAKKKRGGTQKSNLENRVFRK